MVGVLTILAVIGGAVVMSNGFDKTISSVDDPIQSSAEIIPDYAQNLMLILQNVVQELYFETLVF